MVGKNKLGVLVGLQFNDALSLVDNIAVTGLFSYHIRASREHGQVDLSVLVRSELLGAVGALYGSDLEDSVGDHLGGVIGVHLHQPQTGLDIIEKQQFFDAVAGVQFHLLGRGVQDVALVPVSTSNAR